MVHNVDLYISSCRIFRYSNIQPFDPFSIQFLNQSFTCIYRCIFGTSCLVQYQCNYRKEAMHDFLIHFIQMSCLECTIRFFLFPSLRIYSFLHYAGIAMVVGGQVIRTLSMITCGDNFHHFVQTTHPPDHKLVTSGIYRFLRHPSYVGFFYWCVGMQVTLGNIICSILFTMAARIFFHQRIAFEERILLQNYPRDYPQYRKTTFLGIP